MSDEVWWVTRIRGLGYRVVNSKKSIHQFGFIISGVQWQAIGGDPLEFDSPIYIRPLRFERGEVEE
mgnify:FL=1